MDHFRLIAPFYDRLFTGLDPQRLGRLLDVPPGACVLDVGGGTGRVAQSLRTTLGLIVVLDESEGMLLQARRKALPAVRAQAERLPWPDGTFHRILLVDSLHHLADQVLAARELWRVLVPGGRIVIEEPNIERRSARVVALGERLLRMRSHFLRPEEVARLFEATGADVRLERQGPLFWAVIDKPAL